MLPEGAVGHARVLIPSVGHNRLVHGTIPRHVARLPISEPVHVLVDLSEDGLLEVAPRSEGVVLGRVLRKDATKHGPAKIGVVGQGLYVPRVGVHNRDAVTNEASADTTGAEEIDVNVSDPASGVETFDGQFTDEGEGEEQAEGAPVDVGSVVELRVECGTRYDLSKLGAVTGEPGFHLHKRVSHKSAYNLQLVSCFVS